MPQIIGLGRFCASFVETFPLASRDCFQQHSFRNIVMAGPSLIWASGIPAPRWLQRFEG